MYKRSLSFNERFFLATDRITPPFCNQMIYEGEGTFDESKWRLALEIASKANPGSRVTLKGALSFSRWIDSGETPRLRLVDGADWSGTGDDGAPFLQEYLNPFKGPTCEVVLIKGDTPRAAFRTHHAVMDGRGTIHWAEDIFRVLRGEEPLGSDSTLTDYELAMSLNKEGRFPPPQEFIAPTGIAEGDKGGVTWRRIKLDGRYRKLLPQLSVLVAQEARRHNKGKVRLTIPVDLRQRKPGLSSTGNLTNTIYIGIPEEATAETVSKDIDWQIENLYDCRMYQRERFMNHVPISIMTRELKKIIKQKHAAGLYHNSGIISNLGKLDMKKFSGGGFMAASWFAIPPCQEIVPFFMVLAGSTAFANLT
ncbi:MAG TPA: hypothetical protein PK514_12985, partial [Spirochaetota bacterium]|nr:hypothetical protein [Spirochaetota bacterium]